MLSCTYIYIFRNIYIYFSVYISTCIYICFLFLCTTNPGRLQPPMPTACNKSSQPAMLSRLYDAQHTVFGAQRRVLLTGRKGIPCLVHLVEHNGINHTIIYSNINHVEIHTYTPTPSPPPSTLPHHRIMYLDHRHKKYQSRLRESNRD